MLTIYMCVYIYIYIYIYIYSHTDYNYNYTKLKLKSSASKHLKLLNFLQAFSDLTLNKLKVSIRVLDVWMHLILIWVLFNCNVYMLLTLLMGIVIIYLQYILPLTTDGFEFWLHICSLPVLHEDGYKEYISCNVE